MREISIRELGYNFLLKWKSTLMVAVCCMLLFTAWQWFGTEKTTEVLEVKREHFSEEELQQIEECHQAFVIHEELYQYVENAPIMRINPMSTSKIVNQYLIHCNDAKSIPVLVSAYGQYVNSGSVVSEIDDEPYLDELIGIMHTDYTAIQGDASGSAVLIIEVVHGDVESAKSLMIEVEKAVFEYSKTMNDIIATHTLENIYQNQQRNAINRAMVAWQSDIRGRLERAKVSWESLHNALTLEQVNYFNQEYLGVKSDAQVTEVSNARISLKYIVLAFIGSILIAMLYTIISYVIQNKIQSPNELEKSLGVRMLGIIPSSYEEEKSKYKRWLACLRFKRYADLKSEDNIDKFTDNLQFFIRKENADQVYIECPTKLQEGIRSKVDIALKKKNIDNYWNHSFIEDKEALEELREAGNILFVKQAGVSSYGEIEREIAICQKNDINILGIVLLV